jgi:hypothetical protein
VTNKPKSGSRGAGRVAFLARVPDIKKMIDEGYTVKTIYQEYETQLNISYSQFTRYVARYIESDALKEKKIVSTKKKPAKEGFVINPKLNKDLY